MGKKNKPFIDKKNSTTYQFVRRSQRDVGAAEATPEELSDYVLQALPRCGKNKRGEDATAPDLSDVDVIEKKDHHNGMMKEVEENLRSMGLVDTTAEQYERYTMEIGAGTFYSADTGHVDHAPHKRNDAMSKVVDLEDEIREVDRQLESIALTPRCMDDDVAQALFGDFEDGDFEEINDDFCIMADKEVAEHEIYEEVKEEEGGEFDFDAHIKKLMEQAMREERGFGDGYNPNVVPKGHYWKRGGEDDIFKNAKPLHMRDIDEEEEEDVNSLDRELDGYLDGETPGVVPKLNPDEEKALCEKFEETLAEYDSDEVGDLDEECEEIGGEQPLEDNAKLEAIMDDFLTEKRDEIFMEGTRHLPENRKTGGSGYSILVGKKMINEKEITEEIEEKLNMEENEDKQTVDKVLAEADQILANPEVEPPAEEVLIDGRSYFTERERNPWDCESILSTYSNLDNNPVTIGKSSRRSKKKKNKSKNDALPEDETVDGDEQQRHMQILLSNKTGLPIMEQEHPECDDYDGPDGNDTYMSVNKGESRKKTESAAEKKARKNAVKEERKEARMRKKMMKEAFKDEFIKRNEEVVADDIGGTSVFRYS